MAPFATAWLDENHLSTAPVALFGAVLIMNAVAFGILTALLVRHEGPDSPLAQAVGQDLKGKLSLAI